MNINELIIKVMKDHYNVKEDVTLKSLNETKFKELQKESNQKSVKFGLFNVEYEALLILDVSSNKYIVYVKENE